ncbi:glycosyltransferase [bacterium]|nr:glycosyltransferase [bacterium]
MSRKLRWTIAIPTFNGARYIAEAVRSVLAQTDGEFELIVCDDGSKDDTLKIVQETCGGRARIVGNASGQPLGLAGNWNRCVAEASGDWVTILHQDDLLEPTFLARHRAIASMHHDVGLILGPVTMIDPTGQPIDCDDVDFIWPESFAVWPPQALSRVLATGNPIRCPGVSFRHDLHERLGGFDSRWKYVLDWDFWHRAGQASAVAFVEIPLARQRWHQASETHKLARGTIDLEENAWLMRSILAGEPFLASERPLIDAKIRKRMAQAWTNRAYQAARRGDRRSELHALKQAWAESPGVLFGTLVREPRTAARLFLGGVAHGQDT